MILISAKSSKLLIEDSSFSRSNLNIGSSSPKKERYNKSHSDYMRWSLDVFPVSRYPSGSFSLSSYLSAL
jgi:hypothetical protein